MVIKPITDPSFQVYGRVHEGFDTKELQKAMLNTPQPDDVVYEPSVAELEALDVFAEFQNKLYGGMPIQFGYCNGDNHLLNCVEYHRDSEFNLACTDLIVMVGKQQDVEQGTFRYDSSKIEAFRVPAGTLYEFYATTLHYSPVSDGGKFRCVVVLPRFTNFPLTADPGKEGEAKLLTHINKWLIAHPDTDPAREGAHIGIIGANVEI